MLTFAQRTTARAHAHHREQQMKQWSIRKFKLHFLIWFFFSSIPFVAVCKFIWIWIRWILVLMLFHTVLYVIKSFGRSLSVAVTSFRIDLLLFEKCALRMVSVCVYCSAATAQYVSDVNNAFSSERHVLLFRSYLMLLLCASVHSVCALVRARNICYLVGYRLQSKSCFDEHERSRAISVKPRKKTTEKNL